MVDPQAVLGSEKHLPLAGKGIALHRLLTAVECTSLYIIEQNIELVGRVVAPDELCIGIAGVFLKIAQKVVALRGGVVPEGLPGLAGTHPLPVVCRGGPGAVEGRIAQQGDSIALARCVIELERDRGLGAHVRKNGQGKGQHQQGREEKSKNFFAKNFLHGGVLTSKNKKFRHVFP